MALTVTRSTAAKTAAADRETGGTSLLQAKYVVFCDSAAAAVRICADTTSVTHPADAPTTEVITATGTAPAGVTTPIGNTAGEEDGIVAATVAIVIGDVGAYHIDSLADAQALCSGAVATFLNYVLYTVTGTGAGSDVIAVVAGDTFRLNPLTITQA